MQKSQVLSAWRALTYNNLPISKDVLNLGITLFNGQAFTWRHTDHKLYYGVCRNTYFEFRYDEENNIEFRHFGELTEEHTEEALQDYFQLNFDYEEFKRIEDDHFQKGFKNNPGLRIMRQDPWECYVGFLCSQNNNIKRIQMNVLDICRYLGSKLISNDNGDFFTFPSPKTVASKDEQFFKEIGLGYRAKYLVHSAAEIESKGGEKFLNDLRKLEQDLDKKKALIQLKGIGPKVADCICLYSLDCPSYVPVDTHMLQIYTKVYKKAKPRNYDEVSEFFCDLLGKNAGIAHSFLFSERIKMERESLNLKEGNPPHAKNPKKVKLI